MTTRGDRIREEEEESQEEQNSEPPEPSEEDSSIRVLACFERRHRKTTEEVKAS